MNKVAVTGANGYLGAEIINALKNSGNEAVALSRNSNPPLILGEELPKGAFESVEALVHCAYDFSLPTLERSLKINRDGSEKVFNQAKAEGVKKIIYISSMAAFEGCASIYGKTKLATEKAALDCGVLVIRPGTIYGGTGKGLIGSLERAATKLPVVPLIGFGEQELFLIHVEDLVKAIIALINSEFSAKKITLAAARPVKFKEIISRLAKERGKNPVLMPVPAFLPLYFLKMLESLGIKPAFRSDSLLSLNNLNPSPQVVSRAGDFSFREFPA